MSQELMTSAEIQRAQSTMGLIVRMLSSVDWQQYIATVSHAETIGPFVDPTAWIRSPRQLREETTELARLFLKATAQWEKCKDALDKQLAKTGADALQKDGLEYDFTREEKC